MIVGSVKLQKLLIGKLRDHLWVAAGFHTVGCIREQRIEDLPLDHFICRGKSSLHLIIDDAIDF